MKISSSFECKELPCLFYVHFIIAEYGALGNILYSKYIPKALTYEVDIAYRSCRPPESTEKM
jgi:hypothetical protein